MRVLCTAVPLFLFPALLAAQTPSTTADSQATIDRIYHEELSHGQAFGHLKELVGEFPGRLSGSESLTGAIQWGVRTLTEVGLDDVRTLPVMVPHWVRGAPESVRLDGVSGQAGSLAALALGQSGATPPEGLTAEVVEVHSLAELQGLGEAELKGKIVFFNRPMNPATYRPGKAYSEAGDQRTHGPSAAAKFGAAAVLVRSLTQSVDDIPHTGTTTFEDGQAPIPAAALSLLAADRLSEALKTDPHTRVTLAIHAQQLPDAPAADVIGEIKGSEAPEQVILIGGHLDSWDIAPGAHDDGSGVVQSIEVLRIFRALGLKPRHTIRCVLFVNEENGLRGAIAYAAYAKQEAGRHLFALETDNGGFDPKGFQMGNRNQDASQKARRWEPLFAGYGGLRFTEGGGGADVTPLAALGVPVAELTPDSQRYFDIHHTRTDSIDKVNPRELHLGAAACASLVWLIDQEGL